MIAEYGWSIVISVYLAYSLGAGVVIFLALKAWELTFEKLLDLLKVKREFLDFVYAKYRNDRVYTPVMRDPHSKIKAGDTVEVINADPNRRHTYENGDKFIVDSVEEELYGTSVVRRAINVVLPDGQIASLKASELTIVVRKGSDE